jgi:hypothetical protein
VKLRLPILALSAAIALSLSACTGGAPDANPGAGSNRPAESAEAAEPAVEETEAANSVFGETYTYTDGLSVTIGAPQPYTPSEYASKGTEPSAVSFEITVVNGSDKNFDPSIFYTSVQSSNVEATAIFDSGQLAPAPTTTVLPGREVKWAVPFGVLDPADMVMDVTPGFEYQSRIFTN